MRAARVALVIAVSLVIQLGLLSRFSVAGARPELMVLVAILGGYVGGGDTGAAVGFASGLAIDVFLATPFGFTAFVLTVVGYVCGRAGGGVVRRDWWLAPVFVAIASPLTMITMALVGEVFGLPTLGHPPVLPLVLVVTAVNLALTPAMLWVMQWCRAAHLDRRPAVFIR